MKLFRQFILLAFTLLLLLSSTGVSVGMHLCGGELRDLSLFGEATDCPMEQQKKEKLPPCHTPKEQQAPADDCCQDHEFVVERLDVASDTKALIINKTLDLKFIAAVKVVVLQLFSPEEVIAPSFTSYTSPPLARNIPVLVQSFLL
ncbi:HYC_CC_PP family protein [Pontibacter harenae]|uniref:HYC_CC_PP family protein n=1 Tax=Pontibacter harenae TaxID=2894083 RepID=UPI001E3492FD|nr:hypothetical protein [Pontibacter harenae]MCC9167435.1 hypothetical protein [Pontibacter harenae]